MSILVIVHPSDGIMISQLNSFAVKNGQLEVCFPIFCGLLFGNFLRVCVCLGEIVAGILCGIL